MVYVISSKDFEIRFNINMITQIINWTMCLFLLNVAFNNCSVISRQCLVATGSNAHFFSTASLKYHGPDTWHDTTSSHTILILGRPVLALPCKSECQASTIGFISRNYVVWPTFLLMNVFIALKGSHFWFLFGISWPGTELVTSHS